jgi:hypothetical protein
MTAVDLNRRCSDGSVKKFMQAFDRLVNEKPYQFATAYLYATTPNHCGLGRSRWRLLP